MDIGQRALDYHKSGYNCAQSVFAACCEYTGFDEKTAASALSAGFGGGARSGELCGAVTGAIMAEGLVFPFNDGQDTEAKGTDSQLSQSSASPLHAKSTAMCAAPDLQGNIDCSEILAFMAKTAEDNSKEKTNGYYEELVERGIHRAGNQ